MGFASARGGSTLAANTAPMEEPMHARRNLMLAAAAAIGLGLLPALASADGFGTAADAKAMLDRAIVAVKADKSAALTKFIKGEDGFRDRDLYVFCAVPNGTVVAHPTRMGVNIADEADKNGKMFGQEILNTAKEGTVSQIGYMWPRPGTTGPVPKQTYYTRVNGLICGVGYYQ
jgi:hypothetical protein